MARDTKDEILHDHNHDGIDRRGFLKCMAWAGTGAFCVMQGGVLKSYSMSRLAEMNPENMKGELSFVQISDSHMGFNKAANPDVAATLKAAVDKINALSASPEFLLHTGDISHLSKPEEFDGVEQILKSASAKDVFYVPGEHDVLNDDGKAISRAFRQRSAARGLVQLRKEGCALRGPGQRDEPEGRRVGHAGARATRVAGKRRQASEVQHADRRLRAHSALGGLSGMGMGNRRQCAGVSRT